MNAKLVLNLADQAVCDPRLQNIPIDLIMAMLFLQSEHPALRNRVMKYLRAESLSDHDRTKLAGITPLDQGDGAQAMIERLGQLMWKLQGAALILCVDQLEDVAIQDGAAKLFPRAITGLIQVSEQVPSAMIVISLSGRLYVELKQHLLAPAKDRIAG